MGFEPILTESQSVVLTVDTNVTIGPASRNRTHILEVEALCTIHCTIASCVYYTRFTSVCQWCS